MKERKKFSQMRKSPNVFLLLSFQELECLNNEKVQCMACDLFECDLQIMIDSLKLIFNETFILFVFVCLFSFPVALHFIMFLNYKHFFSHIASRTYVPCIYALLFYDDIKQKIEMRIIILIESNRVVFH